MAIQKFNVQVKGMPPGVLMCRFHGQENVQKMPEDEQAELLAYRDEESGELYMPALWFKSSMLMAAVHTKWKGNKSVKDLVAGCVFILGEHDPERLYLGTKQFEIQTVPVWNNKIKARFLVHRPWIREWRASFILEFEDSLLTEKQVRKVLDDAGQLTGVGGWRPIKGGAFGRFMVVKWEEHKADIPEAAS